MLRKIASHQGARSVRPRATGTHMHKRAIVNSDTLRLLKRTPVGVASIEAFKIQTPGDCFYNSLGMLSKIGQSLLDSGHMTKASTKDVVAHSHNGGAAEFMELNQKHGPLLLIMQKLLQADQGEWAYPEFHSAVLAASWLHEGRSIGVLVDGNDLQSNPAIDAIKAHMHEHGDKRPLASLTAHDFECISKEIQREGGQEQDVMRVAFRIVDLDEMTKASKARYDSRVAAAGAPPILTLDDLDTPDDPNKKLPWLIHAQVLNYAAYDASGSVNDVLLQKDVQDAIDEAIRLDPTMVERFDPDPTMVERFKGEL